MTKPEEETPVTLRTRAEIEREYTDVAALYGDRLFKSDLLQKEIHNLKQRMAELNIEGSQYYTASVAAAPAATAPTEKKPIPIKGDKSSRPKS
jgi:hypothetical protein